MKKDLNNNTTTTTANKDHLNNHAPTTEMKEEPYEDCENINMNINGTLQNNNSNPSSTPPSSEGTINNNNSNALYRSSPLQLEDLDLVETIGVGTFGRVVLAHDPESATPTSPGDYYALKVLSMYEILEGKQLQHVKNERDTLIAGRNHPFIINMMWHTKDSYNIYFLLEFASGGELFSYLRRSGNFTPETASFYAAEIICALEYLHKKDIAHRDLKPENLLLDEQGHLKLTDFGYSKRIKDRTKTVCGTPEYLAPEMVLKQSYTKAVDFWALGILIFEMLTGRSPFYSSSHLTTYDNIVSGKVPFPEDFDSTAKDLVQRLLVPERNNRLGTGKGGVKEIKDHPLFRPYDWKKVMKRQIVPPIIPNVMYPGDTSNFGSYPYSWKVQDVSNQELDLFADF